MDRDAALQAVRENVKNDNLISHMLATEAVMRSLARRFGEDEEVWGLAGLLHDIDVELTEGDMSVHSRMGAKMVVDMGYPPEIAQAILCHNEAHGIACESLMAKALYCADPLTGLITAAALIRPDRKLAGVQVKSLKKRFKENRFAAGVSRQQIIACGDIDIALAEFMGLGLEAMQGIADELGL